ncbi:MAG: nucleoside deaminase [Cytophagales bacterium]|nr:MAG: nucleoside deaminase [Cytophagales bacterium]
MITHEDYMQQAYKQALMAYEINEIPVGAVVVAPTGIIAQAHNQTELLQDVTAHAEMLALTAAANHLGAKFLEQCTLYVTLEPCLMCAGALYWARLKRVVFAASDAKRGFERLSTQVLHPHTEIIRGILETPCQDLLQQFFRKIRQ